MKKFDLHIHTNTDCNLRCRHCYNYSGSGQGIRMPLEKLIRYLKFFNAFYQSEIHLEGGEIFLYQELLSAMDQLGSELLAGITVTSNGTVRSSDPKILNMLRRIGCLRISVEGHKQDIHSAIRDSSLKQIARNALFYQQQGIPIALRITLHACNQDSIFKEGIPYFETLGFSRFQIYEFQSVGRGSSSIGLAVKYHFEKVLKDFADMETGAEVTLMLARRRRENIRKMEQMLAGKGVKVHYLEEANQLSVKANGDMTVCAWDGREVIANIFDLTEIELKELLDRHIYVHQCEFCSQVSLQKVHV